MKHFLFITFLFCNSIIAQDNLNQNPEEVSFAVIENVPIYKGCKSKWDNQRLRKCMSDKIIKLVTKNFNIKIASQLDLPDGKIKISALFKVDKTGEVIDITSRSSHPDLEKETNRVISLIPKMIKSGYHKGKPVTVPYALPIIFQIQTPKKNKRKSKKRKV